MNSTPDQPRRWLITGASSGIGRAIAERAIAAGDKVVATVRTEESRGRLLADFDNKLDVELLDLTEASAVQSVAGSVLSRGPVDVLVNNAGYAVIGAAEEMSEEQIQRQLDTMLLGPILLTRAVLPSMREQGGGRIIQVSSVGGQIAGPGGSLYNAAKWGLEGFTEAIAKEVAPFGIQVSLIEPGTVRTGFRGAMQFATEIPAYAHGPVADFRAFLGTVGDEPTDGDPTKLAEIIIDLSRAPQAPLRLALGLDAYTAIESAYTERTDSLHEYRGTSSSIAYDD